MLELKSLFEASFVQTSLKTWGSSNPHLQLARKGVYKVTQLSAQMFPYSIGVFHTTLPFYRYLPELTMATQHKESQLNLYESRCQLVTSFVPSTQLFQLFSRLQQETYEVRFSCQVIFDRLMTVVTECTKASQMIRVESM